MDPSPAAGRIHAFMVTYRRVESTVAAVAALLAQSRPPDTIIVVNNGDEADGAAITAAHPSARVRVVNAGDNIGPAGGWELGVRTVLADANDGDWLLMADDEAPPPDHATIERLLEFAQGQVAIDPTVAGVGLVGGRFDRRTGTTVRLSDAELVGCVDVDTIGGGHWPLLRVAAIRSVQLPDPTLFFGFEELEYFLKIREAGLRLIVDGAAWQGLRVRWDRVGTSNTTLRRTALSPWRAYYSTRNQILIAHRFGTRTARWRAAGLGAARAGRSLIRRDIASSNAHLRGVWDGLLERRGRTWAPSA